jgi:anti-sigma factor ChrR (cupin superfamily)
MELNADFSQRAVVHAARLAWTSSPTAGVDRRMLDRIGDEVARATSIVRYAPKSRFPPHTHGGGEEFLVLEGVFSDEHGNFPAGSYLRSPPSSHHTPGSEPGCIIFVKLWQFDPNDRTHVRIDTGKMPFQPVPERPGVAVKALFHDAHEDVRLERWAPGAEVTLSAPGGMEFLVLEGSFEESGDTLTEQSWLRLPSGVPLRARTAEAGCRVWVKTGHVLHARFAPRAVASL